MSIPLDNLYHYIENVARDVSNNNIVIYRFFPHGSKNIEDFLLFRDIPPKHNEYHKWLTDNKKHHITVTDQLTWVQRHLCYTICCNDQEPLDYNRYKGIKPKIQPWQELKKMQVDNSIELTDAFFGDEFHIYDKVLLLHSEQRSSNLEQYCTDSYIPVYYWSHGLIALDWFRFANHVEQKKKKQKTFLIYNRAWSGTREYRLKFAEHLVRLGLEKNSKMSLNPIEPELGIHYETHQFENSSWRPSHVLENYFPLSTASSHYSANFEIEDYEATEIEVVLETLFDDRRLHLTEKSLRPIACAQPFILAGTHGSLEYLRKYGFKTFGHIWDERYDLIEDPEERLLKIAELMKQIANWTPLVQESKMLQARAIAEYNKKHFFSKEFFNLLTDELKFNLTKAITDLETTNTGLRFLNRRKDMCQVPQLKQRLTTESSIKSRRDVVQVVNSARQYYIRSLSAPSA
jgi:hypothetical protein